MKLFPLLLALAAFSLSALAASPDAAPPAGHPPIEQALAAHRQAAQSLPQQGTVLSTLTSGIYSYIEVKQGEAIQWLAAQSVAVKPGDTIRFDDGAEMVDFHSKALDRTFPSVLFVSQVVVSQPAH